jgi:hypothetical protein
VFDGRAADGGDYGLLALDFVGDIVDVVTQLGRLQFVTSDGENSE